MAEHEHVPTAMVFGKSGMGKSYLCNCLLFGSGRFKEGFGSAGGASAVTSKCEARTVERTEPPPCPPGSPQGSLKPGGPLKMIDTPGIPDPAKRTLEFYDEIIRTLRNTGGLNAFIMVLNNTTDRDSIRQDMETYRILLKQFAKLPVFKVVVCRVRLDQWATAEQQEKDLELVKEWVTDVLDKGGMASAEQVYIKEDSTMMSQYFALRSLLTDMPWTPVGNWNAKTHAELTESTKRLIDHNTRADELREKYRSLRFQNEAVDESIAKLKRKVDKAGKRKGWSLAVGAATALTGVGLPLALGAGLAFFGVHANKKSQYKTQISNNKIWKGMIDIEMEDIARELRRGETNRAALEEEKRVLRELEKVATS